MNKYIITEENGNKLLAYLGQRPYMEVNDLIRILTSMEPYREVKVEENKTSKK